MAGQVTIYFAGDDARDRAYAAAIASRARAFAQVTLMDVDQLDRIDARGGDRPMGSSGAGVFVVSPAMASSEHNRAKLAGAAPKIGLPGHTGFYICRGTSVAALRERYPDLEALFDKVAVGEEGDLDEMIVELREYVLHPPGERLPSARAFGLRLAGAHAVVALGVFHLPLAVLAFPAAGILLYLLPARPGPSAPSWLVPALAALLCFGAGIWLNRLPALDLWAWLGRRWRPAAECWLPPAQRLPRPQRSRGWLAQGCLEPPEAGRDGAECSGEALSCAEVWWLDAARRARAWTLVRLAVLLVPAALAAAQRGAPVLVAAIAALAAGLLWPPLYHAATDWERRIAYRNIGLTEEELGATDRFFTRDPLPPAQRWLSLQTWAGATVRRRWRRAADSIFISYAWADPTDVALAQQVAAELTAQGRQVFLDRRKIGRFGAWRSQVSEGLLCCTHLVVIVGPKTPGGRIIRRELKMALQRWYSEVLPSVILVVEPAAAAELASDAELPAELRFALAWCPAVTHAQARDTQVLDAVVRQRRRGGLWRDLGAILAPEAALAREREAILALSTASSQR